MRCQSMSPFPFFSPGSGNPILYLQLSYPRLYLGNWALQPKWLEASLTLKGMDATMGT